jgi:hypothetical protein
MRFPSNLADIQNWINFNIFSYSRSSTTGSPTKGASKGNISLPVPHNLVMRSTSNYDCVSLGQFGNIAANLSGHASDYVGGKYSESSFMDLVKENSPDAMAGIIQKGLDKFDVSDGIGAGTGLARNPHIAALYRGENFRGHSFSWKLCPTTNGDSDALDDIIHAFRAAKAPDFTLGNSLFKYPDEFQIQFSNPGYLYRFKPCVLIDIMVDYHGAGVPAYFNSTTAPVVVELSLHFSETEIITRSDIDSGY